jgi:4-amino-4-deoxychorismate lyase
MLAMDGRLVCGISANLFLVRNGRLFTPAIRDCGVAGVMRHVVLQAAVELGIPIEIADLEPGDLDAADEVFLTNAVRGIRTVLAIAGIGQFEAGPVTQRLRERLESESA